MASSDFWHDLAAQFRILPGADMLHLDWDHIVNGEKPFQYQMAGGNPERHSRFEALARRAAFEMPNPEFQDLLLSWFEALRKNSLQFGAEYYFVKNADGSEVHHVTGSIHRLGSESARLCDQLESDARQREFEEKQQSDPRNWSPLRQRFEAFKAIKKLQTGPHEPIPEALVRDAIADQLGIKPEDVTWKQITFEVAGLLRDYPAITLIPTELAPSQFPETASAPDSNLPDTIAEPKLDDPKALRDSYLANFPDERIKIRDLCWAAGQHYREWKRWLAGELKNGSTPDLAFRRMLASGKRPLEFNKKQRPDGWE